MNLNVIKAAFNETAAIKDTNLEKSNANDIAIIGINAQVGNTRNLDEFWSAICDGCDLIRDFPSERWEDANNLYRMKFGENISEQSGQGAYLDKIDQFDATLFNIANTEADLMDPAQRLFLESAWSALEDAGYGGEQLSGSRTGVYVGYNSDGEQYSSAIKEDADTFGISMSGNISSIIASRISYCLNLKGPAINIDTACSSSLTAVNIACQQLRTGEISMALVGSVRITLVPRQPTKSKLGIESSSQRTKTFEDSADGTGGGEGVITMVLKPLSQAMADNDSIYAVIKGSGTNQDGASVGITAPNAAAQEDVIRAAWEDAEIDPETIAYIEAHGTATNLGDPVEITGIEGAFRRFTDKKQFCAIGSVKSNIGHLDCASGIAGLLKAVLMLKYKKIPPLVHFSVPNRKIDFTSSPVYINDKLVHWEQREYPRRCGVSSFGLSGTNCHVVLEEAPVKDKKDIKSKMRILSVSAKNRQTAQQMVLQYQDYLLKHPECNFDDFCYTANVGRGQYNCRFAVVLKTAEELVNTPFESLINGDNSFYGEHKATDVAEGEGYISYNQKKEISEKADLLLEKAVYTDNFEEYSQLLKEIAQLYVFGADVNWNKLYKKEKCNRISIPTYLFNHKRHWLNISEKDIHSVNVGKKTKLHPLIDECVANSHKILIYETRMSIDEYWELSEHRVNGKGVLPGTAFIEMVYFVCKRYYKNSLFELNDLIYLTPLSCDEDEVRLVHTIINVEEAGLNIAFYSKTDNSDDEWICNAEVKVGKCDKPTERFVNINEIISRCDEVKERHEKNVTIVNIGGIHWSQNLKCGYANGEEIILDLCLAERLRDEAEAYSMLPSLLDQAISSGHYFSRSVYIPYCFEKARFYEKLPINMFSYIKKKPNNTDSDEIATFDITLCDENGRCIAEVENYVIKKIHQPEFFLVTQKLASNMFFNTKWVEAEQNFNTDIELIANDEIIIAIHRADQKNNSVLEKLKYRFGEKIVTLELAEKYIKLSDTMYQIGESQQEYDMLLSDLSKMKIKHVIHLASYRNSNSSSVEELKSETNSSLKSTFLFVKAILNNNIRHDIQITLLTLNGICVTGKEKHLNPINHALSGMGLSINDEYSNIKTKAIDCDEYTDFDILLKEIQGEEIMYSVAYRENQKYKEKMESMSYSEETFSKSLDLKDNGVYIIAGGMGGMGLSFTKYLLGINPTINIILINRTYSETDIENVNDSTNEQLLKKLDVINKLKKEGKTVRVIKADISDYNSLSEIIQEIRHEYGSVNGVINTAGVASDGFMMNKEWEAFENTLNPKVYGTWALFDLVRNDNPSFFVMCSSLASVYGAPGQIDYVAANAYLDSFTDYCRNCGVKGLTINWTGWSESGMAVDNNVNDKESFLSFVNDAEGAVIFAYALKTGIPRILAGELNYRVYASESRRYEGKVMLPDNVVDKLSHYSENDKNDINIEDIIIFGKSMDRLTDVEKDVILIWSQVLGIKEIDIHDKFFESGGNSLLASTFQKEMNKKYPGVMTITDIFTYSTIARISEYISTKLSGSTTKLVIKEIEEDEEDDDIEDLVKQFVQGDIKLDEIEELLK